MLSSGLLWTVFIIYLCFLFFIATMGGFIQKHRTKNTEDFSTGSGTIRWPFLVMTYIASLMSSMGIFRRPPEPITEGIRITGQRAELYLPVSGDRSLCL